MKTRTEKVRFSNDSGFELDGRLELPAQAVKQYAVFCHCFTCTKDTIAAFRVSREMAKRGYAVLRFDFTGLGSSEGEFADTNFTSNIEDIRAAVRYLTKQHQRPSLFIGHSLGGTALLRAALSEKPDAVVTIAAPGQPAHVLHHFGEALHAIQAGRTSSIRVAGRNYTVKPQLVRDLKKYDMQSSLRDLHVPVLIFNIRNDALVSGRHAVLLQQWIGDAATLVHLEGTDHVLSDAATGERVADTITRWFEDHQAALTVKNP